ncbi:hypothetical protein OIV83_005818 [Microbotryomycetes sp. JL201]|nr:hypothetical protein OIV83_005818 [Microbotryomycetes sp. JL201]
MSAMPLDGPRLRRITSDEDLGMAVVPKAKLIVTDLDNTLFAPARTTLELVKPRPFLRTFIEYVMHSESPYRLAIWTFSGRMFGIQHLRSCGVGDYLFADNDAMHPALQPGCELFWGFEDSMISAEDRLRGHPRCKPLDEIWRVINSRRTGRFDTTNSFLLDDQIVNGDPFPSSIIVPPLYTKQSPDDDFLFQLIGYLDELAPCADLESELRLDETFEGLDTERAAEYSVRAIQVCKRMGIAIRHSAPVPINSHCDLSVLNSMSSGPSHDANDLQDYNSPRAEPAAEHKTPPRLARGMTLCPSSTYLRSATVTSRYEKDAHPLVVFDLDGTLYCRPPQALEHDTIGNPAERPYLRTMLDWLLNYSPYHVAIWTGSPKQTAVHCLDDLGLGIVSPTLGGPLQDEADMLHPKLVAFWAREDFGLTPNDFDSYVAVVKDLDKLHNTGVGNWNETNTIMVDDTPSKLRAQPFTLIGAPTFNYPKTADSSSFSARTALTTSDTFLLELVAMLDMLCNESNMTNVIRNRRWWDVARKSDATSKRWQQRLAQLGASILAKAGVPLQVQGKGRIPVRNVLNGLVKYRDVGLLVSPVMKSQFAPIGIRRSSAYQPARRMSTAPSDTTDEEDE